MYFGLQIAVQIIFIVELMEIGIFENSIKSRKKTKFILLEFPKLLH